MSDVSESLRSITKNLGQKTSDSLRNQMSKYPALVFLSEFPALGKNIKNKTIFFTNEQFNIFTVLHSKKFKF